MNVTPAHVRAAYTLLRQMPPFDKWALPKAEELRFGIIKDPKAHAEFNTDRKHSISINSDTHLTLTQLLESVAHEMVHLQQELKGVLPVSKDGHNAYFRRWRKQVCHSLGFDVQKF